MFLKGFMHTKDSNSTISKRLDLILTAVITSHINNARPVSSALLAEKFNLGISPATVRNNMAELESIGFLTKTHASSGSIPTEKSYRHYANKFISKDSISKSNKKLIDNSITTSVSTNFFDDVFYGATKMISNIAHVTTIGLKPIKSKTQVKEISFVPAGGNRAVCVVNYLNGLIETRVLEPKDNYKFSNISLQEVTNYINQICKGHTLREVQNIIEKDLKKSQNIYKKIIKEAFNLGSIMLSGESDKRESLNSIVIEGRTYILEAPEFREDFNKIKKLINTLEEKETLKNILGLALDSPLPQVYMGGDLSIDKSMALSFVGASYNFEDNTRGVVGLIGPLRMDYSKIIPIINYATKKLSTLY